MGVAVATLAGHRATSARVSLPAWGCWWAEVSVDGEVTLTGSVELKIADLTLKGTVLSGGPDKGRSHFRIVAGAGGWGKVIPKQDYVDDAGVRMSKVLANAADACGETFDASTVGSSERVGPKFVRREAPAARVLEQLVSGRWYVAEDGVTRVGRRPSKPLEEKVTIGPVDRALGTVTIAADSIAGILPGIVVAGLEAVDVEHEISSEGLRSTIWATRDATARASRAVGAIARIVEQLDPNRDFRGVSQYRVVTLEGKRLNLQPVRVSTGMPDLRRVRVMPGVAGCDAQVALGARVLVAFADADPGQPFVVAFEDAEGEGFVPTTLNLRAGAMVGGEHVATVEATCLLIYNVLVSLMTAAGGGPLLAVVLQPLIGTAINAALAAQAAPAPPTAVAQAALAASLVPGFATGTQPSNTSAFFSAAIEALANKTANDSGLFPSIGSKAVEAG